MIDILERDEMNEEAALMEKEMSNDHFHGTSKGCYLIDCEQFAEHEKGRATKVDGKECLTHRKRICRCGWEWHWHNGVDIMGIELKARAAWGQ